jgi:hypothetical protein
MDNDQKELWKIARDAFQAMPSGMRDERWMRSTAAVESAVLERLSIRDARADQELAEALAVDDPNAECKAAFAAGKRIQYFSESFRDWLDCDPVPPNWYPAVRYRVKPDPVLVPLGPEDVPPFSAIRWSGWETTEWALVLRVTNETVYFADRRAPTASLGDLRAGGVKINRSIPLTGKWDATAWEPCSKEQPSA